MVNFSNLIHSQTVTLALFLPLFFFPLKTFQVAMVEGAMFKRPPLLP